MLSKKDKQKIREIIQEELKAALFWEITIERGPRKQGDPEKVIKHEKWNILEFLGYYLPFLEGALRGMQEDVDHAKNEVAGNTKKLNAVGQTLLDMEGFTMQLGEFLENAKEKGLLEKPKLKLIDLKAENESNS